MKTMNKIIIALLAMASFTACDGLLNMTPEDTLSPGTFFSSATELQLWTDGFYTQLENADDVVATNADDNIDSELGAVLQGQRSAADESGWNWDKLRSINYYLQHSDRCKDMAARNEYDGVAYFMRAYFYYVKVRRYGDVPWYNQVLTSVSQELLFKPRDDRGLVMDSIMNDLDRAIRLLPAAKSTARVTKWTALALKTRVALYEGTYRKYRGMNDADKYLKQVAEAGETFIKESGYKLYTTGPSPYRSLFNSLDACTDEVILARLYSQTANVMHGIPFAIKNGRQGFTKRFMNHYLMADGTRYSDKAGWQTDGFVAETTNRDPRMQQTVLCPGYIQTGASKVTANDLTALTGYQPIKFVGESKYDGANKAFTDWPLFRTAEVYLNYAEAKAELGTLTQNDLDISINKLRARAKMPDLDMNEANATPDPLMQEYYPNVTQSTNTGVILEIRRERTIELTIEGFRLWDIFRWKEGQQLTKPFYGCYFPSEGEYDMDANGTNDLLLYTEDKGNFKGTAKKLGKDLILTNITSGNIHALDKIKVTWDENRDYLWPIPASERVVTGGKLTQNPGWTDSTNFD